MGAWGHNTFDNDTAADWAAELAEAEDLSFVTDTLDEVLDVGDDYLDSDEACRGLAACEVVARLKGNGGARDDSAEGVDRWVAEHPKAPSKALVKKALAVIDRVARPPSELLELWGETKD